MKTETVGCQWKMGCSRASVQPVVKSGKKGGSFVGRKRSALVVLGVVLGLGAVSPFLQAHALELSEAVAKALNNRPEVSQAVYATAAARERVGSSLSDFLPTINLRAANGREETDNPTTRATGVQSLWLNPQQRGITVTQNIYRGLGSTHQVLSSQANARAASWKVLEVSEATAMRAVDSYLNVMKNQGQIKAAQESVDSHKALLDLVQRRAASGAGTKADVNQAQARVKQAQAVLSQIQSTQDVAYATFEAVFGHPPEKLQEPSLPDDIIPKERKEALKLALEIHPAIFSAQESYFASKEQALSQNSAFSPAVNLLLTANNDENLGGSPGASESMSAVVEMTVNAFSGYRDMHAKREATFNMAQAQSVLDKTVLDITENLANSYAQLTAAKSRRELFATQAQENEKVRNAFFKQYRIGQRTLLDLLDVENELFSARNNLVVEHYQELSAKHRVLTNMGQLLRVMSIEVPSTADPLTVGFFSSVQSLFDDPEKVVDRWPAMERWIEQKKMALREPIEQKSPFIPKHNDTRDIEQPVGAGDHQTPSAPPKEGEADVGDSGPKRDNPVKPDGEGTPEQRESQNGTDRQESPFISRGGDTDSPETFDDGGQAVPEEATGSKDGDAAKQQAPAGAFNWFSFKVLPDRNGSESPDFPAGGEGQTTLPSQETTRSEGDDASPKQQVVSNNQNWPSLRFFSGDNNTQRQLPFFSARSESDDLERQASADKQSLPSPTEKTKPAPDDETSRPEEPANDTPWRLPFFSWGNTTGDGGDGDGGDDKQQTSSGVTWESSPFIAGYNKIDFAEQSVGAGEQAKPEVDISETTGPVVQQTSVAEVNQVQSALPKESKHADSQRRKQSSSGSVSKQGQHKRVAGSLSAGNTIKKQVPTKVARQIRPSEGKGSKQITVKTAKQQASLTGIKPTQPVPAKNSKEMDGTRQKRG